MQDPEGFTQHYSRHTNESKQPNKLYRRQYFPPTSFCTISAQALDALDKHQLNFTFFLQYYLKDKIHINLFLKKDSNLFFPFRSQIDPL